MPSVKSVVLDVNVLVSALLNNSGSPAHILEMVFTQDIMSITCPEILVEFEDVLSRSHLKIIPAYAKKTLQLFRQHSQQVSALPVRTCFNPDDDKFLACALASQADLLITGDHHLLEMDCWHGIRIVTPREALMLLKNPTHHLRSERTSG